MAAVKPDLCRVVAEVVKTARSCVISARVSIRSMAANSKYWYLALAVILQRLEVIVRWNFQVRQHRRRVEHRQFAQGTCFDVAPAGDAFAVEQRLPL